MQTDNCPIPVLEDAEWSPTESTSPIQVAHESTSQVAHESTSPIDVAYDEENNAVTFHERGTGQLVHAWVPDRPDACAVADLFLTLASKPWASVETLQATAATLYAICVKPPGQITLQDELVSILRNNANRWMTTGELAAEVNRRGRHWKAYRNRITAAKVLLRTKLYARTFERMGERVRLITV